MEALWIPGKSRILLSIVAAHPEQQRLFILNLRFTAITPEK
jgi:hypothetical protein